MSWHVSSIDNPIEYFLPINGCNRREDLLWAWDKSNPSEFIEIYDDDMEVRFNKRFSNGTAIVRGTEPMANNQFYWEIKLTYPVYGTDVMIGVGTEEVDTEYVDDKFVSRIGMDDKTWGLSHRGLFHHKNRKTFYAQKFDRGDVIGVHLDLWRGTLSFFKNRKPLGIASSGLRGKTLYAMASSTAACTGMRILRSCSFPSCLQFLCAARLRELVPDNENVLDALFVPPGLKNYLQSHLSWLLDKCYLPEGPRFVDQGTMFDQYDFSHQFLREPEFENNNNVHVRIEDRERRPTPYEVYRQTHPPRRHFFYSSDPEFSD